MRCTGRQVQDEQTTDCGRRQGSMGVAMMAEVDSAAPVGIKSQNLTSLEMRRNGFHVALTMIYRLRRCGETAPPRLSLIFLLPPPLIIPSTCRWRADQWETTLIIHSSLLSLRSVHSGEAPTASAAAVWSEVTLNSRNGRRDALSVHVRPSRCVRVCVRVCVCGGGG